MENLDTTEALWSPVPTGYGLPWDDCAVLAVVQWENSMDVHGIFTSERRQSAWNQATKAKKTLPFAALCHEYLYEGVWIVTVSRAKARA